MSSTEQLQSLEGEPDLGLGPLGQLTHSVLRGYLEADSQIVVPRLHLGQNTLPNPPFPMSSHLAFPDVPGAWEACGKNLLVFLEAGARSLRIQSIPPVSEFGEEHRMLRKLLRTDSIAMALRVRYVMPTESVEGWTATADALAGRLSLYDLDPEVAGDAYVVWGVDRAGTAILMWAPAGSTEEDIGSLREFLKPEDPIVAHLMEVLDAQYTWTSKVFGIH
jgi:hypothetical protein